MLQISSGKFYETADPDQLYVTTHHGVLYTNYLFLGDRTTTPVGDLLPAARSGDLQTIVCNVTERLPKRGGQIRAGDIVSVGPDTLIHDFAALISFRLNITCTPDRDLAQRLIAAQHPPLGIPALPRNYVTRVFNATIPYRNQEVAELGPFITDLISLERKWYSGIMRAIRRYVTAMHRIADDLDLAYALLVASIESLAQEFDGFSPTWNDYDHKKRKNVDEALQGAPDDVRERVRQTLLASEHTALKKRFCAFCNHHLQPTFFRTEATDEQYPAGRTELEKALRNAYDLRSKYIHALSPLPKLLASGHWHTDIQIIDSLPFLTLHGLARVARHVIMDFIRIAPKVEHETFDYTSDYPNLLRMSLAPEYWIHNADTYSLQTSRAVLNGFLSQVSAGKLDPTRKITDIRAVQRKIESLLPTLAKPAQKIPMLALHYLFTNYLRDEEAQTAATFLQPYLHYFDQPSIDSLLVHLLGGQQTPEWPLDITDTLMAEYGAQRFQRNGLDAGPLIGAALTLWVAEMHRAAGDLARSRELVAQAVEEYPQQKALYAFERDLSTVDIPEINCWRILLPSPPTQSLPDPNPNPTTPDA